MEWIRLYFIFLDRIYRMYKIFSRFHPETGNKKEILIILSTIFF